MTFTETQVHAMCNYLRECKKCPSRVETSYGLGQYVCYAECEELLDAALKITGATVQPGAKQSRSTPR